MKGCELKIPKTISHCQGKGSITHNNRDFIFKNVDQSRTQNNITYAKQSLSKAYDICFGDSVKQYNEKQKRADRKINGSYYEELFGQASQTSVATGTNKQKSFYETLVQIGTKDDSAVGTADGDMVAKCLDEYMMNFTKRNPNFYVFNAVLHLDEATPHLHIDYIPVGHYNRGMGTQNGLAQALKEMGYGSGKDAINRWRLAERKILEEICKTYSIQISEPKKARGFSLLPEEYKEMKDAEIKQFKNSISDLQETKKKLEHETRTLEKKIENKIKAVDTEYNLKVKEIIANAEKEAKKIIDTGTETVERLKVPSEIYEKLPGNILNTRGINKARELMRVSRIKGDETIMPTTVADDLIKTALHTDSMRIEYSNIRQSEEDKSKLIGKLKKHKSGEEKRQSDAIGIAVKNALNAREEKHKMEVKRLTEKIQSLLCISYLSPKGNETTAVSVFENIDEMNAGVALAKIKNRYDWNRIHRMTPTNEKNCTDAINVFLENNPSVTTVNLCFGKTERGQQMVKELKETLKGRFKINELPPTRVAGLNVNTFSELLGLMQSEEPITNRNYMHDR